MSAEEVEKFIQELDELQKKVPGKVTDDLLDEALKRGYQPE